MRDIKFRAWHNKAKLMAHINDCGDFIFMREGERDASDAYLSDVILDPSITAMQYTGLKDKNGVEVYEGDIIRWTNLKHYWVAVIEPLAYDPNGQLYAIEKYHNLTVDESLDTYTYKKSDSRKGARNEIAFLSKSTEVIGNIHENPELLDVN